MKKFLSVILAALILACPLSGFATEAAQTLEWYFCEEEYLNECYPWTYNYAGEVTIGDNEITFKKDEYCSYYTFNAETAGYYYVECFDEEIGWFGFPESIKNGKAYREAELYYITDLYNDRKVIFKFNEGETFLGIDFSDNADTKDSYNIKIEYIGSEIKDIVFEEGTFDNLVIDYDIYNNDFSEILTDITVVFTGDKTLTFSDEWIALTPENFKWVKGENKATALFWDFEKEVVVTACEMTDLVKDVEFVNYDYFDSILTDFRDSSFKDIYGAELIFTLANGEKVEFNTDHDEYLEINGREYWVYVYYNFIDSDNTEIIVYVGGTTIESYKCTTEKRDVTESAYILGSEIRANLKSAFYFSRLAISEMFTVYDASGLENALLYALNHFEIAMSDLSDCVYLLKAFFDFYLW